MNNKNHNYTQDENLNEQPQEWPQFTLQEVSQHKTEMDGWIIYRDKVYNLSGAVRSHPGPISCILIGLGTDMTRMIDQKHAGFPIERMLGKLQIGVLKK